MVKNLCDTGDTVDGGSVPGSGRCPEERNGHPLQYLGLQESDMAE